MAPSEKPSRNGQETDPEAERTTVLASEAEHVEPAEEAPVAPAESNGHAEPPAPQPPSLDATEDIGLGNTAPPPWQRVSSDSLFTPHVDTPDGDGQQPSDAPLVDPPTVDTRQVVTGTAAARMFGEAPVGAPPPGGGYPPPPPRTTVHLEGANAATSTMRPATGAPASSPNVLRRPGRGPRRANLQIKRVDPWSVLKLSLVLGVALFFVWLVAVGALYAVLDGMGVWDKVNGISTDLLQGNESNSAPLISAGRVFGIAAIVGAVNIVLFSALATVGAFVYNVSADLAGGLEVTLAERE